MGKNTLLMVIGFNFIFVFLGINLNKITNQSFRNYVKYLEYQRARNVTASGLNYAVGMISIDTGWTPTTNSISIDNSGETGSLEWSLARTIVNSARRVTIRTQGIYGAAKESTTVVLTIGRFSEYAFYSEIENNINWTTGDTCWGPLHTQQRISIIGSPVFMGRVTSRNGLQNNGGSNYHPQFFDTYREGVDISLPANINPLTTAASSAGRVYSNTDIYLQFLANGNVVVRQGSWGGTPTIFTSISNFATNGILHVQNGNLYIKGTVSGRMTICATGSSGLAKGNVYIDSSVVYNSNPLVNPLSTDMLGIVAENNVFISNNSNNRVASRGVTIHATIMCRNGGVKAVDYSTRGYCGQLTILGGIQQRNREPVGVISGGTISDGFHKNYRFDNRMANDFPPGYPQRERFRILSWYSRITSKYADVWEDYR